MDIEIMASVQEHIIGNCLCVFGDAMAMPIGSMIAKFRDEFEEHIESARVRRGVNGVAATDTALAAQGALDGPRGRCSPTSPAVSRPRAHTRAHRARTEGVSSDAASATEDHQLHDRRPRGPGAREHDAGRRRQARRRRDPGLLLRTQARPAGRRLPHVPGRNRGHPQAPDRLLDAGQGRHGRPHPVRAREGRPAGGGRVPAGQPSARLPRVRQGRGVPAAGHHLRLGRRQVSLHRPQAPLRQAARAVADDRDRQRALHPLLPLRALLPGDIRGLPARPARARCPLLRRRLSTGAHTSRRSAATSSSCARWGP